MNLRKMLMEELKRANKMLEKYETAILDGSAGGELDFYKERVSYWSNAVQELRQQIMEAAQMAGKEE